MIGVLCSAGQRCHSTKMFAEPNLIDAQQRVFIDNRVTPATTAFLERIMEKRVE